MNGVTLSDIDDYSTLLEEDAILQDPEDEISPELNTILSSLDVSGVGLTSSETLEKPLVSENAIASLYIATILYVITSHQESNNRSFSSPEDLIHFYTLMYNKLENNVARLKCVENGFSLIAEDSIEDSGTIIVDEEQIKSWSEQNDQTHLLELQQIVKINSSKVIAIVRQVEISNYCEEVINNCILTNLEFLNNLVREIIACLPKWLIDNICSGFIEELSLGEHIFEFEIEHKEMIWGFVSLCFAISEIQSKLTEDGNISNSPTLFLSSFQGTEKQAATRTISPDTPEFADEESYIIEITDSVRRKLSFN